MLDKLLFTCNAVLPLILVILLGYVIKRIKLLPDEFFKAANKLCFRICLPVLLFYNIYNVESLSDVIKYWKVILFSAIGIASLFFIGLIIALLFIKDNRQKGVILQSAFRSNYAYIGIPLAASLATGEFASDVVGLASIVSVVSVPMFNILAIVALSIFNVEGTGRKSVKSILLGIIKNPLIIGVFSGIVVLAIRQLIPTNNGVLAFSIKQHVPFIYKTIENVSKLASPLALIALGGQFTFKATGRLKKQILIATITRIVLVPVLILSIAYLIGFRSVEFPTLIALFATPVAVSSVPMSAEMGSDDELAGQIVVYTSICSAISLFAIIFICSQIGIFVM